MKNVGFNMPDQEAKNNFIRFIASSVNQTNKIDAAKRVRIVMQQEFTRALNGINNKLTAEMYLITNIRR